MRSRQYIAVLLAILASVSASFPKRASAQQTLGTINGTVTDASGAVIQGVQVNAVNSGTGLARQTSTSGAGTYAFQDLPIGTYALSFIRDGFDTQNYPAIVVQADRTATLNAQLKVGATSTSVQVEATPLLNSTDTTNGYVLDSAQIQETPLGTGSFTQLALLSPGVNADFLADTGTNTGLGNQNIWANGQRLSSNTFTMNSVLANNLFNGASSSQVAANRAVLNTGENFLHRGGTIQTNTSIYDAIGQALPSPPQETIEEIRVNTSMFDAQQGTTAGAHIDVTTMSGTNAVHGSLYGKLANASLNAAPYFFNQDVTIPENQKVPDLHRELFGATLGAPIIKNKLFFFGSYQMTRVRDKLNSISSAYVPTALTNDRSTAGLINAANTYCAAAFNPSNPTAIPTCSATGYTGTVDPIAAKLLSTQLPGNQFLVPSFQSADINGGNANIFGPASTFDATQINGNLDYNVTSTDVLSEKYYFQRDPTTTPFPSQSTSLLGFPQRFGVGSQVASIENNKIFSPNLSWDQKVGFIRMNVQSTTGQPFNAADAGINVFGSPYFPGININDVDGSGDSLGIGPTSNFANTGFVQNTFEGTTDLNWVLGKHTLSFGGNGDFTQMNIINRASQVANLSFSTFSDFLSGTPLRLGEGNSVYFQGASNRYYRAPQVGSYAQDRWKVLDNLTVTLGLRYDWDAGLYEKNGNLVNFNPAQYQYNLSTDTVAASGLVVAGNNKLYHTAGASDSTLTARQWGFGPRIGLAWSPKQNHGSVVFRAGAGMYYDRGEFFTNFSPSAGDGFNGPFGVTLQPPFVQPVLATASSTLENPFGTTPPPIDTNPADFINNLPNQTELIAGTTPYLFGAYNAANKLPYTENWSLDMQWQARPDLAITIGYTGNHGVHQTVPLPFNQPLIATTATPVNGQTYSYGYQVTDASGNPIPNEPVNTPTGGNTDLRVPYIGYSPNSVLWTASGISHYNALLTSVKKTFSHGLQGGVSYTFSHGLDESSGYGLFYNGNNARDLRSGYATSDYDRTHVLTLNYVYQLPQMNINNRTLSKVANGWGWVGLATLESGQPYNVYDFSGSIGSLYFSDNDFLTNPVLPLAPGFSPRQALTGHSGATLGVSAFNPNAFALPRVAPGTEGVPLGDDTESDFGVGGRNIFRGDFQKRADMSLVKETQFADHYDVRFSFDVFNITNTPSFDTPNNNVSTNYNFSAPPTNFNIGTAFSQSSQQIGIIQHTLGSPRQVQFAAKLTF
ncbi:Oar protein [Acidisarcina polymorpha]|uniref:Oar protein n=1 Tax=Acidisarcina polymorpha TaxID=2211140 RepID=A0A2Z5G7C1_9BACT|nr:TonB-dependent receptor [Acidisarcina polymorpha]AXC14879.1 Oar protein [Acidisarcina polymorpha]